MSLKNKTILATKWSSSFSIIQQIFGICITIILARLLSPKDFGLMAIVASVIGLVRMLQDIGLGPALVQKKELNEVHINTVFWTMLALGTALCLSFLALAGYIAEFYNDQRLYSLIIVSSIGFILSPFFLVQQRLLERQMDFKTLGKAVILSNFLSGIFVIYLALRGFGVWSLVLRAILIYIFNIILIWRSVNWRPKFNFSLNEFKEMLKFGVNLSASKVIGHLRLNIVYLILGKLLGSFPLGIYRLGDRIVSQPLINMSSALSRALLSSYSKVQNDNSRLCRGYLISLYYLGLIIFPCAAGIIVTATEIIPVVFGEKWSDSISIIQWLTLVGVFNVFINAGTTILYAKGRPDISLRFNILSLFIYIPIIIFSSIYGIKVVAISMAISSIPVFIIVQTQINNLIELSWYVFLKNLNKPFLFSVGMAILVVIAKRLFILFSFSKPQIFILEIVVGVIFYAIMNLIFNLKEIKQIWEIIIGKHGTA